MASDSLRLEVEKGHVLLFARSIGELDPGKFSEVAPPTFVVAADQFDDNFAMRPHPEAPWIGSGRRSAGVVRPESDEQLHAEQRFRYHRPVRVGSVLLGRRWTGDTWVKTSRRGGSLEFEEVVVEFLDEDDGQLVVTATTVSVRYIPET